MLFRTVPKRHAAGRRPRLSGVRRARSSAARTVAPGAPVAERRPLGGAELTSDFAYDRFTHPKKRTEVLCRVLTLPHPLFERLGVFFSLWQWLRALPPVRFFSFFEKSLTSTGMRGTILHT